MKKVFLFGLFGAMIALFSACNAYTQINSTTDPKANFLKYKTFAWLADKADSSNSPYNNDIIRNNIRNYFSKEMSDRGYTVNTEQPDLLLELAVKNEPHTIRQVYYPKSRYNRYYFRSIYFSPFERQYYYTHYHNYYYTSRYPQIYTDTHINNSVTLNIVDAKERQLLWSGTVEADIYDPSVIQKDIHPAIIKLMKLFPVKLIKPIEAIAQR
jgi:Domain of unknown function (DUF4136)